jgi:hypothetical protein
MTSVRSHAWWFAACLSIVCLAACGHDCGLGLHGIVTVQSTTETTRAPCCGGFVTRDVSLTNAGDGEFDISNVGQVPEPVDAFLVPTSCSKLFDGDYPGATPLCQVYLGPVVPKSVSGRVKLSAGTYRLWMQAYSTNVNKSDFLVDIGVYDYRCVSSVNGRSILSPTPFR